MRRGAHQRGLGAIETRAEAENSCMCKHHHYESSGASTAKEQSEEVTEVLSASWKNNPDLPRCSWSERSPHRQRADDEHLGSWIRLVLLHTRRERCRTPAPCSLALLDQFQLRARSCHTAGMAICRCNAGAVRGRRARLRRGRGCWCVQGTPSWLPISYSTSDGLRSNVLAMHSYTYCTCAGPQ